MRRDKVLRFLSLPADERPAAPFRPDRLDFTPAFDEAELERLRLLFSKPVRLDPRRMFSFMVSLTCASSALEGNTYNEIDTRTLLEDGISAPGKTDEETKMLLNHKQAFGLLIRANRLDRPLIEVVHAALANDDGVEGSIHFLPVQFRGVVRTYDEIHIGQTTYIPPVDYPGRLPSIAGYLSAIIETANKIDEPLDQSLYLFTRLPYLQAFRDCNKRTSRLIGNLPLLLSGRQPVSFSGIERPDYNRSMVAFYELGDVGLFKENFVAAYVRSGLRFHAFEPEVALEIHSRDTQLLVRELVAYVEDGRSSPTIDLIIAAALDSHAADDPSPGV